MLQEDSPPGGSTNPHPYLHKVVSRVSTDNMRICIIVSQVTKLGAPNRLDLDAVAGCSGRITPGGGGTSADTPPQFT